MRISLLTSRRQTAAILALVAGCVSPVTTQLGNMTAPTSQFVKSQVISVAELDQIKGMTMYDAIHRLRPSFLRSRDPRLEPVVYVDHTSRRSLDELKSMVTASVAEIQYLDSRAATQRYGTGHGAGVILVLTRTGPR